MGLCLMTKPVHFELVDGVLFGYHKAHRVTNVRGKLVHNYMSRNNKAMVAVTSLESATCSFQSADTVDLIYAASVVVDGLLHDMFQEINQSGVM